MMAKVRRMPTSLSMPPERGAAVVFTIVSSSDCGGPYSIAGQTVIPYGYVPKASDHVRDNMAGA